MRNFVGCIAAVGMMLSIAGAAEKTRDWQTGTVLDSQRASYYRGTFDNANTSVSGNQASTYGSQTAVYAVYENFMIEGPMYAYFAQERLRFKWNKPANLTVNAPVKFAVEKRKLYVIDNDGKEHEMEVTKQVAGQTHPLAQAAPSQAPALSNADILKLKAAGLSDALIVGKIEASSGGGYKLGVDDLLSLKQQGLSDAVVQAMIRASQGK